MSDVKAVNDFKQSLGLVVVAVLGFLFVLGQLNLGGEARADWPHAEPLSRSVPTQLIIPTIGVSSPIITVMWSTYSSASVPFNDATRR